MLNEKEIDELSKEIRKKVASLAVGELEHVQDHIKQLVESHIETSKRLKSLEKDVEETTFESDMSKLNE